jgi:hypothetical protein
MGPRCKPASVEVVHNHGGDLWANRTHIDHSHSQFAHQRMLQISLSTHSRQQQQSLLATPCKPQSHRRPVTTVAIAAVVVSHNVVLP